MNDVARGDRHEFSPGNDLQMSVIIDPGSLSAFDTAPWQRDFDEPTEADARTAVRLDQLRVGASPLTETGDEVAQHGDEQGLPVDRAPLDKERGCLSGGQFIGSERDVDPNANDNRLAFGTAYGLALQGVQEASINTNLLPGEIVRERLIESKKPER